MYIDLHIKNITSYTFLLVFKIVERLQSTLKGTIMQIWKFANIFVFIWKYVQDFTLKYVLLFEICPREINEKSETMEYVKNKPTF